MKEIILKQFKKFVPEDDGSAMDWLSSSLDEYEEDMEQKIKETEIGLKYSFKKALEEFADKDLIENIIKKIK